ncbi:MAG TPA: hypothetical protein PKH10_02520 [bacterium]|nr:hypothetical protein [bacterium]HSA33848.1 hypothetical protein [bacterium]
MNTILPLSFSDFNLPGAEKVLAPLFNMAVQHRIELMCIGAAALPIALRQQGATPRGRFTQDMDVSFAIRGWDEYFAFIESLLGLGLFHRAKETHRLYGPEKTIVDLVPFGGVAGSRSSIKWPPENDTEMSVLGFDPVYTVSPEYLVDGRFTVRIPRPEGFLVLKLFAWADRKERTRKDAEDIGEILYSCCYGEELYTRYAHLIDRPDFDFMACCAEILGIKIRDSVPTLTLPLAEILKQELAQETSSFIATLAGSLSYGESQRLTRELLRGLVGADSVSL